MFANNLIELTKKAGLTWYRLAIIAGIDHSLLLRYRQGRNEPRIGNLKKLAKALDCEVGELLK